jgi:hypothetical protein
VRGSGHEPPGEWIPAPGLGGSYGAQPRRTYDIKKLIVISFAERRLTGF